MTVIYWECQVLEHERLTEFANLKTSNSNVSMGHVILLCSLMNYRLLGFQSIKEYAVLRRFV